MKCATVQIKGADGKPVIINKEDFIEDRMEIFVEGAEFADSKPLDRMNKEGLIAVAAEKEVELDGSETKVQILEKINTVEAAKAEPAE